MPTPLLSLEEATRRINAINDALRAGHRPPGQTGPGKGALREAAAALRTADNNVSLKTLERIHALHGLEPDWSLYRPAEAARAAATLPPAEEHRLKRENAALRAQLADALDQHARDEASAGLLNRALNLPAQIPAWTARPPAGKARSVIPVALFSDWHLDEVVDPKQVNGRNGYDRAIAERRLRRYFDQLIIICRDYLKGFHYPGIVFPMLGDNFSGHIHEELARTNADTTLGSLNHWLGPVAAGLRLLADEFGQVFVPVVVGNHGRNSPKPIAKMRVRDNFDWLFGKFLARQLEGDRRIRFLIGESHKQAVSVFDTRLLLSHGDECKGGSGIAGMLSPQLIAYARMKKQFEFDLWCLGHWHQRGAYRGIRVNGTGKGFDEYSAVMNFDYQVPQQDLFFVAPERGVIADMPVFCQCDDEPWRQAGGGPKLAGGGKERRGDGETRRRGEGNAVGGGKW